MKCRPYTRKDYDTISCLWRIHGWEAVPEVALSTRGLVVETSEIVCAGWVYQTDSCLGWFEWVVSNPAVSLRTRLLGLNLLVKSAAELADRIGIKATHTSCKSRGLIKLFQKYGFKVGDTGMTNLLRAAK